MSGNDERFYTKPLERVFLARRRANIRPSLPKAILKIAHALADWQNCPPLSYSPSLKRHIQLSESDIVDYLYQLEDNLKNFVLSSHSQNPQVSLYVHTGQFNEDQVFYFLLPSNVKSEFLQTDKFINLSAQLRGRLKSIEVSKIMPSA
jgi:hypothetical protein